MANSATIAAGYVQPVPRVWSIAPFAGKFDERPVGPSFRQDAWQNVDIGGLVGEGLSDKPRARTNEAEALMQWMQENEDTLASRGNQVPGTAASYQP